MTTHSLFPPADNHFQSIYQGDQTHLYDEMILAEDVENNILKTLQKHIAEPHPVVLDVGAGTGRLSRLLAPSAAKIVSVDLNVQMLRIAQRHQKTAPNRWHITAGDATKLPLKSGWADVAAAGWAIGHFNGWFKNWVELVDLALGEMARSLKPNGVQIMIETMGTGFAEPQPPTEGLAAYYAHLENQHGFTREVIRTDYHFPSLEKTVELVSFFFGADLANHLRAENSCDLIEWTGVWVREVTRP